MAVMSFEASGLLTFEKMLASSSKDIRKACNAGGEVARQKIAEQSRSDFTRGYSRGTTASNTKLKKAAKQGDGYAAYVTFNGTRNDGWCGTVRRNAEVAFINEFGAPKKKPPAQGGHPARPFIQHALDKYEDQILDAIEKALPNY